MFECIVKAFVTCPDFDVKDFCQSNVVTVVSLGPIKLLCELPGPLVEAVRIEQPNTEQMKGVKH